jgi:hypothetical protein
VASRLVFLKIINHRHSVLLIICLHFLPLMHLTSYISHTRPVEKKKEQRQKKQGPVPAASGSLTSMLDKYGNQRISQPVRESFKKRNGWCVSLGMLVCVRMYPVAIDSFWLLSVGMGMKECVSCSVLKETRNGNTITSTGFSNRSIHKSSNVHSLF